MQTNSVRNQERFSPECSVFCDRNSANNFQFPLFRCVPHASPISPYLAEARISRTSALLNFIHPPLIPAHIQTFSILCSHNNAFHLCCESPSLTSISNKWQNYNSHLINNHQSNFRYSKTPVYSTQLQILLQL